MNPNMMEHIYKLQPELQRALASYIKPRPRWIFSLIKEIYGSYKILVRTHNRVHLCMPLRWYADTSEIKSVLSLIDGNIQGVLSVIEGNTQIVSHKLDISKHFDLEIKMVDGQDKYIDAVAFTSDGLILNIFPYDEIDTESLKQMLLDYLEVLETEG